jgi:hypothetical protein
MRVGASPDVEARIVWSAPSRVVLDEVHLLGQLLETFVFQELTVPIRRLWQNA